MYCTEFIFIQRIRRTKKIHKLFADVCSRLKTIAVPEFNGLLLIGWIGFI